MNIRQFLTLLLLLLLSIAVRSNDDDAADDDAAANDDAAAADDYANDDANDDAAVADDYFADDAYEAENQYDNGDDYIKYWSDYAILPKRCIVYNNIDVIVFSVFDHSYKQCSDEPIGTYIVPVSVFVAGWTDEMAQKNADEGIDDYVAPDAAEYVACSQKVVNNVEYYLQVGCADGTTQAIGVNIYSDNTCETRDVEHGSDDANVDLSEIQIPFKQCTACVNWVDVNDDAVDDQFYENKKQVAPLCSKAWQYREDCDRKCQRTGLEARQKEGWNTSDKILLAILALFGFGMLVFILHKRRQMSNKDALLEQAAMSAAGLQQAHVIGIFVLIVIVITVFALLGLKNITWALLLIMNTVLFGYLMKLTIDSGVSTGETIIGPDGTVIRRADSDDSSMDSERSADRQGAYVVPQLPDVS
mmetsp:Transcript_25422/g.37146  ORF Transcript_25422/g.37146 Transcript_25422/m.37146 type:complete len:417 (-) Transcript_25422:191-1441(-)|eukprot:CAMPEP_0194049716 /NCGR_PEP_ID=MMETSP0009_2-20130614/30849_1 /TAXON_ID=210454 /ORGANISM="Grammatophora oceanica, Strain CCMP 410" /LENGTH=416 /DNA_ID=CAMNT_0038695931 /DNA_START=259 /DNA_END=1509 /DNA_ORIENTATION=+